MNQFRCSPKHVTPSCFGPNLGRNQPNISLQRQVWALQVAALHNLGKDAPVSDSIMATCDDMVTRNLCFFNSTHGDVIWIDRSYKSNSSIYRGLVFSGMPVLPRNSAPTRMTSWEAAAWLGSLLLETAGETVVPYAKPLRQQDINKIYTWQWQMHGFLTYVETTDQPGVIVLTLTPFRPSNFCWPKHRYSFCSESVSVNVMSCPGTTWGVQIHLTKKNMRGQRSMTGVLHKSRKFGPQVFYDLHSSGLKRHHSERSWLVLQEATFLPAEWTTRNWNC